MTPKAQPQFDLIGKPQSQHRFGALYYDVARARTLGPDGLDVDGSIALFELLQQLDIRPSVAATECYAHVKGATARAAQNIAEWVSYLPADCVRAMIRDGWHWST
jgi:hypothetical protein